MHTTLSTTAVRWLAADAQYCPCCTSPWLFLVPSERCLRGSAGAPRQLEISKWPFAGVSRCRCNSSALHVARLCLRFPYLAGLSLCRKGLLGDEQAAISVRKWRFGVENGSERRLRRGRSRPRGLVVTVSGDGAVFSMSASFGPPYSEHDRTGVNRPRSRLPVQL